MWINLTILALSYLIGSVNFAVIFSRLFKHTDIRAHGSGNPGTVNTLRCYGLPMAALVLACDAFKGWAAVYIAGLLSEDTIAALMAGVLAIIGHAYPVFFGFKGGKSVAVAAGVVLALRPDLFPLLLVIFALATALLRSVTVRMVMCASVLPLFVLYFCPDIDTQLRAFFVLVLAGTMRKSG